MSGFACAFVCLYLLVTGTVRGSDLPQSVREIKPLIGLGLGMGTAGASYMAQKIVAARASALATVGVTKVVHSLNADFYLVGNASLFAMLTGGEHETGEIEFAIPMLATIQYLGLYETSTPYGLALGAGPVVKYGTATGRIVLAGAVAADVMVGNGKRLRLYSEVIPGASDGEVPGSRRFSRSHLLMFLWNI